MQLYRSQRLPRTGCDARSRPVRHHWRQSNGRSKTAARSLTQAKEQGTGFDLSVAVALAAAAFEAYLEPTGAKGFEDTTVNGTLTTYTDRQFVLDTFEGLLELTVHKATDLPGVNLVGGSSDPYVVANIGESSGATPVVWNSTSPVWDATFPLYVRSTAEDVLRLRVFDKNNLLSDKDLGAAMVRVSSLLEAGGQPLTLPLRGGPGVGQLVVSAAWQPFTREETELLDAVVAEGVEAPNQEMADMAASVKGEEVSVSAAAAGSSDAAGTQEDGPKLGDLVAAARSKALEVLQGSVGTASQQLKAVGLQQQAQQLQDVQESAAAQVVSAADSVDKLVASYGLGSAPINSVAKILEAITAQQEARSAGNSGGAGQQGESGEAGDTAVTPEQMQGAWKALARCAGKMVDDLFTPVAYLDNPGSDTQVWLQVSRPLREVVVAFRGTEQVKWKDLAADLNLIPTSLDAERTGSQDLGLGIPMPFAGFRTNKELMVHSGFLSAYDTVRPRVLSLVDSLTKGASPGDPWVIWVTGHSLGGALATLCAYELAGRQPAKSGAHRVIMYTYGAPRCGNKAFADAFDDRLDGAAWRITNSSDIVPTVPRLMGYAHVQTGVRLGSGGALEFESDSKDLLGEGREVAEAIADLAGKALEAAKAGGDAAALLEPLKEQEMAVLNSLVDGSALEQHMEDFYLLTLKDCVLAAAPELRGQVEEAVAAVEKAKEGSGTAA